MIDSPKVESTSTSNPPRAALRSSCKPLQRPADHGHERDDEGEAEKWLDPKVIRQNVERVGREHREASVRARLMTPMTPNMQRQAAGDQRVIAAEQNALNNLVDENQALRASARDDFLRPK